MKDGSMEKRLQAFSILPQASTAGFVAVRGQAQSTGFKIITPLQEFQHSPHSIPGLTQHPARLPSYP